MYIILDTKLVWLIIIVLKYIIKYQYNIFVTGTKRSRFKYYYVGIIIAIEVHVYNYPII